MILDIAPSELIVVGAVALLVIPPKDLPKALRMAGKWMNQARGLARQFRSGFDDMIRDAELAEMEKKWRAENERIMREYPPDALPPPDAVPSAEMTAPPALVDEVAPVTVTASDPPPGAASPAPASPAPASPMTAERAGKDLPGA